MKNAKKTSWRKLLAGFAVGGVLLSGLAVVSGPGGAGSLITDASAGVSGGGGGGGGGGAGGTGYATWQQISRTKAMNGTIQNLPPEINSAVCQDAEAYFALVPNVVGANAQRDSWTFSLYGVRNLQGGDFAGGADLATRIANNVGWSYQQGRDYLFQKNFICLDNPNVLDQRQWRYEVRSTSSSDSLNENQVYSTVTQVAPQSIEGKLDPVGAANLNTQTSTVKTNYGTVWDQFKAAREASGSNTKDLVSQFKTKFADAKTKDKTINRADVVLNEGNRAGMGEGGILNISETARNAKATASTTTNKYQVWRCGWEHYSKSGWQPSSGNNCQTVGGNTLNPNALPTSGWNSAIWKNATERNNYNPVTSGQTSWTRYSTSATSPTPTQKQTGFWQLLAVHCNPQDFAALVKALGTNATVLSSGDTSNTISGLIRTKIYAQQPSVLPFGDTKSTNAAQKITSTLGFYDKECPFDCTPDRAGTGASAANGAKSNVFTDNSAATTKGKYGVKSSDGKNSTYSEIFRDNSERTVRPDVWYPVSTKGVNYDGAAPDTTLVTRWAGGTPTLDTEFKASRTVSVNGKTTLDPLFDPKSTTQPNQRNFSAPTEFKGATASQFKGLMSPMTVQSTWASDSGKPQALQVAWEYSPSVTSSVPQSLSFSRGAADVKMGSMVNRSTEIQGRCWGTFGTTATTAAVSDLNSNTGSGKTTNFNTPNGSVDTARNIVLNFVRGASE